MDKSLEQIFKVFSHIAREVQIYFISGFLILLNSYVLNLSYHQHSFLNLLKQPYVWVAIIAVSYVLGHLAMGFYYVILELTGADRIINTWLGLSCDINSKLLPEIYFKNKEIYIHFIERYAMLSLMRCVMCASLFIIFLIDTIYLYIQPFNNVISTLALVSLMSSVILFILTSKTEKDYAGKISSIHDIISSRGNQGADLAS